MWNPKHAQHNDNSEVRKAWLEIAIYIYSIGKFYDVIIIKVNIKCTNTFIDIIGLFSIILGGVSKGFIYRSADHFVFYTVFSTNIKTKADLAFFYNCPST